MTTIRIGVVGLGFGAEFVPIYQAYPGADCLAVCRRDEQRLHATADRFGIERRYTSYAEMLKDPNIDAVHINTDIAQHGPMAIAALEAGKHVACTVPMALTEGECATIVRLERETGKVYMMMETAVYTREYLYLKGLYEQGEIGRIQFLRGSHQQNMGLPGWPEYWYGLPPMFYPTHAVGPLVDILDRHVDTVRCIGSGRIREEYAERYQSPFAVESAHFTFSGSDVTAEVTRSLFDTIRQYRESFDAYGTLKSFEWEQVAGESPVVFSGFEDAERIDVPDTDWMLPAEIASFALRDTVENTSHVSFIQGDGHGGSHPHLVHEFIQAIIGERHARTDAARAANLTVAGLYAHMSAMQGGSVLEIPQF